MFGLNRKKKVDAAASTAEPTPAPAPAPELITAPVRGMLLPLDKVPDPVFAGGLMGPGFAVEPADGIIVAPVAGTIVTVPETLHAVGLRTATGVELLVHVGVDTVKLKGDGFRAHCAEGDTVDAGAVLLEVDLEAIRERVPSLITPVIITNAEELTLTQAELSAEFGQPVLAITST